MMKAWFALPAKVRDEILYELKGGLWRFTPNKPCNAKGCNECGMMRGYKTLISLLRKRRKK